jgi:hypothetical protein
MADKHIYDWDYGDFCELGTVIIAQLLQKARKQ